MKKKLLEGDNQEKYHVFLKLTYGKPAEEFNSRLNYYTFHTFTKN